MGASIMVVIVINFVLTNPPKPVRHRRRYDGRAGGAAPEGVPPGVWEASTGRDPAPEAGVRRLLPLASMAGRPNTVACWLVSWLPIDLENSGRGALGVAATVLTVPVMYQGQAQDDCYHQRNDGHHPCCRRLYISILVLNAPMVQGEATDAFAWLVIAVLVMQADNACYH